MNELTAREQKERDRLFAALGTQLGRKFTSFWDVMRQLQADRGDLQQELEGGRLSPFGFFDQRQAIDTAAETKLRRALGAKHFTIVTEGRHFSKLDRDLFLKLHGLSPSPSHTNG